VIAVTRNLDSGGALWRLKSRRIAMKTYVLSAAVSLSLIAIVPATPASAQQVIACDPVAGLICAGALGRGPCAAAQHI
jgi:hypothetical protein